MADMSKWGRAPRGGRNGHTRLTDATVLEIRHRLAQGEQGRVLAKEYGVGEMTISNIRHNHTWKHI
jgi:hypothetical protein